MARSACSFFVVARVPRTAVALKKLRFMFRTVYLTSPDLALRSDAMNFYRDIEPKHKARTSGGN